MDKDYRNTEYCLPLIEINSKKKILNDTICREHPRARIMYNQVRDSLEYKKRFLKIYNCKCSYCGNSIVNLPMTDFEIDHLICESSFKTKAEAGEIENLVLSCYDCNRAKGDFFIEENYYMLLNPDFEGIKSVFSRDELYYIKVSEDYYSDSFICSFYEKLKLGYETRRLDFLLLKLNGLCNETKGSDTGIKLNEVLIKLTQKRNLISLK